MQITLKLNKDVNKNAADYFEKAKKAKKKAKGAEKALSDSIKKLEDLKKKRAEELEKEAEQKQLLEKKKARKKEWYEKFRWFFSSEGFLVIGGRDATTNEIVIKKHTDEEDIVFHTEAPGSPFCIIKTGGKKVDKKTLQEVADFAATYSRAWKRGLANAEVFWVNPSQVSKQAQAGQHLAKGSFMIYGKKNIMNGNMNCVLGVVDDKVVGGPLDAIKKQTKEMFIVDQGKDKKSDIAKKIKNKHKEIDLDEIMPFLPAGGVKLRKA